MKLIERIKKSCGMGDTEAANAVVAVLERKPHLRQQLSMEEVGQLHRLAEPAQLSMSDTDDIFARGLAAGLSISDEVKDKIRAIVGSKKNSRPKSSSGE